MAAARQALEKLPAEWWMLRAHARLFLSAGYLTTGELGSAYANLYDSVNPIRASLFASACS